MLLDRAGTDGFLDDSEDGILVGRVHGMLLGTLEGCNCLAAPFDFD
jgi:hypothetical protein